MIDYAGSARTRLAWAIDQLARDVVLADGDAVELARALVRILRQTADFYARAVDAFDAAGGDVELAAVIAGSTLLTKEQARRWLAGERVEEIMGDDDP